MKRGAVWSAWGLGLTLAMAAAQGQTLRERPPLENAIWQWYEASGLSDARRAEIAPHFPTPERSDDVTADRLAYNQALTRWSYLYPHEYEAFVNAPELTALNPYYTSYVEVYHRPRFMDVAIEADPPVDPGQGAPFEARLTYELRSQKWLFVFQPERFAQVWGFEPVLPEDVDVAAWRRVQVDRAVHGEEGRPASR